MKKEYLLKLLEITKEQKRVLKKEEIEQFEVLLQERQVLMDQIDKLHQINPEYRQQKEEEILKQIIKLDEENRIEYNKQYNEVQENLKKLRAQKRVGQIYSNPYERSQEEGIFFDKK